MTWLKQKLIALLSSIIIYIASRITKQQADNEAFKKEQDKLYKEAEDKHNAEDIKDIPAGSYTL